MPMLFGEREEPARPQPGSRPGGPAAAAGGAAGPGSGAGAQQAQPPAEGPLPAVQQPPAAPTPTEQAQAAQIHQLRQEVAQLTNMFFQLQQRHIVQMDTTTRRDKNGRIEGFTMIGKLA